MRVLPAPRFVSVCRPSSLVWSPPPVHFNIHLYVYMCTVILSAHMCTVHICVQLYISCSFQPGLDRVSLGTDARHFVHCRKGHRLHGAVSDKVRDELCFILERCGIRTIAERPLSHRQMTSFKQREGAFLLKTAKTPAIWCWPILMLPAQLPSWTSRLWTQLPLPTSTTQHDLKISSSPAPSPIEIACLRDYFGPSRRPPPGARMRVVPL